MEARCRRFPVQAGETIEMVEHAWQGSVWRVLRFVEKSGAVASIKLVKRNANNIPSWLRTGEVSYARLRTGEFVVLRRVEHSG